LFIEWL
nr:Chain A, Peptide LFIEWL from exendin-4 [Heloderma suspectum]8ANL_B Chain B, Peptide LFIEWL from exendin-4 [Heloderma suspectum]8ANL_C Chain C, Peptide LFIEWL from exendin-4 [Heloderma suspectum]8ANL_D Chain D, Peptide LFIEWL from exendin-4 [Heloderma suspectum]8ANN_A Chain A, Peptide LFIEWL from exendin-4 [Heloderma suspectum]